MNFRLHFAYIGRGCQGADEETKAGGSTAHSCPGAGFAEELSLEQTKGQRHVLIKICKEDIQTSLDQLFGKDSATHFTVLGPGWGYLRRSEQLAVNLLTAGHVVHWCVPLPRTMSQLRLASGVSSLTECSTRPGMVSYALHHFLVGHSIFEGIFSLSSAF